jgi:predicted enzyme related to lactoylglutathione lyase
MRARLIAINVPSKNLQAARVFYEALTGLTPARALSDGVESYHVVVGDGLYVWLSKPFDEKDDNVTAYFAVDDLDEAIDIISRAGGTKVWNEIPVPLSQVAKGAYATVLKEMGVQDQLTDEWGRVQLMKDPNGCVISLVEIQPHSQVFYGVGKYRNERLEAYMRRDQQTSLELAAKLRP